MALIKVEGNKVELAVPVDEAVRFAMGWSDAGLPEAPTSLRRTVGELAVGALEHAKDWRGAEMLRGLILWKWSGAARGSIS